MERILILMQAANWAEATEALTSARENALHRNALSYALVLPEAPTSPEKCNMAAFGALRYLVSPEMTFAAMETLWHGERYALLAHPAMRFERDWEKKLLRALNDCPVENANPMRGIYCAVTSCDTKGNGPAWPQQILSRRQALYGYTAAGAYTSFDEDVKGMVKAGMYADFITVDTGLLSCSDQAILNAKVTATWVNGEKVYQR